MRLHLEDVQAKLKALWREYLQDATQVDLMEPKIEVVGHDCLCLAIQHLTQVPIHFVSSFDLLALL